jgi:hypothetical protein
VKEMNSALGLVDEKFRKHILKLKWYRLWADFVEAKSDSFQIPCK